MIYTTGHFQLTEILTAGSTDYKVEDIPEELHNNLKPTLDILEALRVWYKKPIHLNCTYRSAEHNKKAGGAKNSLHLKFNAIDFTVLNKQDLPVLYKQLDEWDKEHHFSFLPKAGSMGIGFYADRFIHIDSRAILKRKSPSRWKG